MASRFTPLYVKPSDCCGVPDARMASDPDMKFIRTQDILPDIEADPDETAVNWVVTREM
jgi:hypothetical protein